MWTASSAVEFVAGSQLGRQPALLPRPEETPPAPRLRVGQRQVADPPATQGSPAIPSSAPSRTRTRNHPAQAPDVPAGPPSRPRQPKGATISAVAAGLVVHLCLLPRCCHVNYLLVRRLSVGSEHLGEHVPAGADLGPATGESAKTVASVEVHVTAGRDADDVRLAVAGEVARQ